MVVQGIWDITLVDETGIGAVAEIKNRMDLTPELARDFLLRVSAADIDKSVRFIFVFSQDFGHLWLNTNGHSIDRLPDHTFSMEAVVKEYLPSLGKGDRLQGTGLASMIGTWFQVLKVSDAAPANDAERLLANVGFIAFAKQVHTSMWISA